MEQESTPSLPLGTLLLTFTAGAALGALVTALTTPRSGPELRGDLKELARRAKRKACSLSEEANGTWDEMKERTLLAAADLKRGMKDARDDLKG
jgi:gas vesicle protein